MARPVFGDFRARAPPSYSFDVVTPAIESTVGLVLAAKAVQDLLLRLSRHPHSPPPRGARPRRARDRAGRDADPRRERAAHAAGAAPGRAPREPRRARRARGPRPGGRRAPRDGPRAGPRRPGSHARQRGRQHRRDGAVPVDRAGADRARRGRARPDAPDEPLQPGRLRRRRARRPHGRGAPARGRGGLRTATALLFWLFAALGRRPGAALRAAAGRPRAAGRGRRPAPPLAALDLPHRGPLRPRLVRGRLRPPEPARLLAPQPLRARRRP